MRFQPRLDDDNIRVFFGVCLFVVAASVGSPAAAEPGEHHQPHHVLGVFVGDVTDERREGLTLALEYEYRATESLGVGATIEHVAGDFDTNVLVVPFALHRGPWKVYVGPGIERGEEGSAGVFRVGAEYGFHLGHFEVSPQIDMDFVDGDRLFVIGVVFAHAF